MDSNCIRWCFHLVSAIKCVALNLNLLYHVQLGSTGSNNNWNCICVSFDIILGETNYPSSRLFVCFFFFPSFCDIQVESAQLIGIFRRKGKVENFTCNTYFFSSVFCEFRRYQYFEIYIYIRKLSASFVICRLAI